jgi:regulator of protease activity HflC (stomatin/prohibitin superfamily)
MEGLFAWVQQLWEFLVSLIPHLDLMQANYSGVKFKRGGKVVEIKPGLFWYWPIVTNVQSLPTARQTMTLASQTLQTKDDYTVTASAVVVYEVNDVRKALVDTWDVEDTISDVALRAVTVAIASRDYEAVRAAMVGEIPTEVKNRCKKDLRQFGILVKDAFLSDCASTTAYRLMGDGAVLPTGEPD